MSESPDLVKLDTRYPMSASISKLAAALSKAQGQMENAQKDGQGTYGKYATLAATWEVIRKPMADNELAIYQRIKTINGKPTMCTMIVHSSGEFIDDCELELKFDANGRMNAMQAMGSAVTYARRYCLQAITGVAPADDIFEDDGNASGDPKGNKPAQGAQKPAPKNPNPKPQSQPPKPPPKPTQAEDENRSQPQPQIPPTALELARADLYSLVDTLSIPDEEVKKIINMYAPKKNSKTMTEPEIALVIKHFETTRGVR